MSENKIEEAIDENGLLRVRLEPMPSGDNPWRTQGDYRRELERAEEMHSEMMGQLKSSAKSSKNQTLALIISMLALIVTFLSFIFDAFGLKGGEFEYINRQHGAYSYVLKINRSNNSSCFIAQSTQSEQALIQLLSVPKCK